MYVVIIENDRNKDQHHLYFQEPPTRQELRAAVLEVRGEYTEFLDLLDNSAHVVLANGETSNYVSLKDYSGFTGGKLFICKANVRKNHGYQIPMDPIREDLADKLVNRHISPDMRKSFRTMIFSPESRIREDIVSKLKEGMTPEERDTVVLEEGGKHLDNYFWKART